MSDLYASHVTKARHMDTVASVFSRDRLGFYAEICIMLGTVYVHSKAVKQDITVATVAYLKQKEFPASLSFKRERISIRQ